MRSTIHMVTARDYPLLAEGTRQDRRAWWLGATRGQITGRRMEAVAREVRELLAEGPRRRGDLVAALGVTPTVWNGVGAWIDLLRVPPSGTWEQRRPLRRGGTLARSVGGGRRRGSRAAHPPVPRWIRPGTAQGHRRMGGSVGVNAFAGARADDASALPGRTRRGAVRPSARTTSTGRYVRARAAPADVGRHPPRPSATNADPPGAVPVARIQHEDAALGVHVARRRTGRWTVETRRRPCTGGAVRTVISFGASRAEGRDQTLRGVARSQTDGLQRVWPLVLGWASAATARP